MPAIGTEIKFDTKDFDKLVPVSAAKAERGVKRTTKLVEAKAVGKAPEVSGNLINMIGVEFTGSGFNTEGRIVSHAPYSEFVHEGTGIYGPVGLPIFPSEKQALWWPGAVHPVKMIRGQKPQPFLREALEETGSKLYEEIFK